MAGHSKWANIRHRKGRQDARRSKIWSKCSRAIIVAAKNGGGDPDANLALRYAIDDAKAQNMPKDTIQKAIEKGAGGGDGNAYEEIVYEGYGPHGVAVLLEILTDNRNRTAGEVRLIFERNGGNLGATGSVAFNFERKGEIVLAKTAGTEDELMELVLEAGAEDLIDDGDVWMIRTTLESFHRVRDAVTQAGLKPESSGLPMIPLQTVVCDGKDVEQVLDFIDLLEDNDDVQNVHTNFEMTEADLATLR